MIKLADILKEYKNQGPTSPEVYILDVENNEVIPSSLKEIQTISNLSYDMGGGESSFYDEYNIVIVDNMEPNDVLKNISNTSNAKKKLYVKYNLEVSFSFPQANEIIISQLVYHLKNIESFAETVNNSLKPNGKIKFYSDKMFKIDKQFIQILIEKFNFFLPDNIELKDLSKFKELELILQKNQSYKTPPEILKFKIKNIKNGDEGVIQYEKNKFGWEETVSGNINPKDFYVNGKPRIWSKTSLDKNEKYPIFVKSPKYNNPQAWYYQEYPSRFKYEFIN